MVGHKQRFEPGSSIDRICDMTSAPLDIGHRADWWQISARRARVADVIVGVKVNYNRLRCRFVEKSGGIAFKPRTIVSIAV
jgi:hypothetical protein